MVWVFPLPEAPCVKMVVLMPSAMPASSGATSRLKMTPPLARLPQQESTLHKQDLRSGKETWRGLGGWQCEEEREEGGPPNAGTKGAHPELHYGAAPWLSQSEVMPGPDVRRCGERCPVMAVGLQWRTRPGHRLDGAYPCWLSTRPPPRWSTRVTLLEGVSPPCVSARQLGTVQPPCRS
jgi:hypothetical protein